jgi:MazG family protein
MNHSTSSDRTAEVFGQLVELIQTLRSENGCPWDRKQTPQTFHPYILEEYHEMVQAMSAGVADEIADELGDLLFLVVFVAYMHEQSGVATLESVVLGVIDKMTRRHPHVFGEAAADTPEQVIDNWRKIKASEKNIKDRESILDGVPRSLPALSRAQKLAGRAARVGFDWTQPEEVLAKIDEEWGELKEATASGSPGEIREELGDLLFVVVNAARHLGINAESALNETSDKFERRFRHIEKQLGRMGRSVEDSGLEEMDALWDEAKALEKP